MMPNQFISVLTGFCMVAVLTCKSSAESVNFQSARDSYLRQDWAAAQQGFLAAAKLAESDDERASAQFYGAECALQLRDFAHSRMLYQQLLESQTDSSFHVQARFRLGETLHLAGDLPAALAEFNRFVEENPEDDLVSEARVAIGEILLNTSRPDAAISEFVYVIEHSGGDRNRQARFGMARALLELGRYDEVPITLGRLCQSDDPEIAAEGLLLLGRARYEAGLYDEALTAFRRVYNLNTDEELAIRARLAAGWALWKLMRFEEVRGEVKMLEGNSAFAGEVHYLSGMTAFSSQQWTESRRQFGQAIDAGIDDRRAAEFYSGESALLSGDPLAAKAMYEKLLESEPTSQWADDAVWGLAKAAQSVRSEADFRRACELLRSNYPSSEYVRQISLIETEFVKPLAQIGSSNGLFEEGVALERDGRLGGAIAAYHDFLAQAKSKQFRLEALWRTARLHQRLKQHAESRQLYTQLLSEFPDSEHTSAAMWSLARIEAQTGNQTAAAGYCHQLLEKLPQSAQAVEASYWLALAAADEQKGDIAQWQVDWLFDRLDPTLRPLSESEKRVLGQVLCLQCQLLSVSGGWHEIASLLDEPKWEGMSELTRARLGFWRAEAALRLGNHSEAEERFEKLSGNTAGVNESWVPMVKLRRAQLAARHEDWLSVVDLVDQLDKQYPEFELAYECDYLRGRARAGRGEMLDARIAYDRVLANDWAAGTETAAMAQWMIGESYFHQGNYELARVAYERVIERHYFPEWQARGALQAGKCAELDDNWEAATKYYADAVERWHDTESAHELNARLRWVQEQLALKQPALRR